MQKITSLALLLLGGCATAGGPRPAAIAAAPPTVNIRPVQADSPRVKQTIVRIVNGPCETNDPMPTGSFRVTPQGQQPGPMPGMRIEPGSAAMPNACPVTVPPAGGMFHHAVPNTTVRVRGPKSPPRTKPEN